MARLPALGLLGADGAGKDTVGQILAEDFGYKTFALADGVRQLAHIIDPRYRELVDQYGYEKAKWEFPADVRGALIRIGGAVRHVLGDDAWVRHLLKQMGELNGHPGVAVTDVRYPVEVRALRSADFRLVVITRPGRHWDSAPYGPDVHPHHINNNGTLADLRARVHELMHSGVLD